MFDTAEEMKTLLKDARCHPLSWYRRGRQLSVRNKMQKRTYRYTLTARPGKDFDRRFRPELTPAQMLRRGVFEGKYLNDCMFEFPREWYASALRRGKLSPEGADPSVNEFGIKSRKSLRYWREKKWIPIVPGDRDRRGWFQWYCRYWMGRRQPAVDQKQISRWRSFRRHRAQVLKNCGQTKNCRKRQRQALLQWAYNPYPRS